MMAFKRLIFAGICVWMLGMSKLTAQVEYGQASYYADKYHLSSKTASGELYDKYKFTAAHRTLKFGTILKVTHLDNGRSVTVTVNDRGPYKKGRIVDLSRAAAEQIDLIESGLARVKIEVMVEGGETKSTTTRSSSNTRASNRRTTSTTSAPTTTRTRPETIELSTGRELATPAPQHGDLSKLPLRDHTGTLVNSTTPAPSTTQPVATTVPNERIATPQPVYIPNPEVAGSNVGRSNVGSSVVSPNMAEAQKYTPTVFRMIAIKDNSAGFAVQLEAYYSYYKLLEGLNRINLKGIDNTLVQSGMKNGKPIFRILAGPYGSRAEAEQAKRAFKRQKLNGYTVNLSTLN